MLMKVRTLLGACVVVSTLLPGAVHAADQKPASIIAELGLEESARRVDQRADWQPLRKIVVRALQLPGIDQLQAAAPGVRIVPTNTVEEAVAEAADADAVIGWCDSRILAAGPHIRWIQFLYAGVEGCVAIPAVRAGKVLLTNMRRVQSPIIAEHAIAMTMALARGLDLSLAQQSTHRWQPEPLLTGGRLRTLKDKTMLVVGLGGIGSEVAHRAHALGMRVIAIRASGHTGPQFVSYVGLPDELLKLVADADVIVDALPLTSATRGTFNERVFAAMKRSAIFVNVGRGGTVVTPALVQALQQRTLAGAALDVTDPEPLPPDHPLWQAPNLIITPHVSSESDLGVTRVWAVASENLRRYVAGDKMLSVVDPANGY